VRAWLLVPALLALVATGVSSLPLGHDLRANVELASDFAMRRALGLEPAVSERLKIVAFDDDSAEVLGSSELLDADLMAVLGALQTAKPRGLLVDEVFAFGVRDGATRAAFARLGRGAAPVAAGAAFEARASASRPLLDLSRGEFQHTTYARKTVGTPPPWSGSWLEISDGFAYGPHPSVLEGIARVGHVGQERLGLFRPVIRVGVDRVLPHLSLFAGEAVTLDERGLYVGDTEVPVVDGLTLVNALSPSSLVSQTFSMAPLLRSLANGKAPAVDFLAEGDVVLVLPRGAGTAGRLAAEVNAFLTNQWIRSFGAGGLVFTVLAALAAALGLALGRVASSLAFGGLLVSAAAAWVGLGLGLFCVLSWDVPWLLSGATLVVTGVAQHLVSVFRQQVRTKVLKQALGRLVPADRLAALAKQSEEGGLDLAPQEHLVTILSFDLVGFSLVAETRTPHDIFASLRDFLDVIAAVVHAHGGMVDKVSGGGDGALCVFGHQIDGTSRDVSVRGHADQAVRCAVEIQRAVLEKNLKAALGDPVFPVRIGVHSSQAFLGDVGGDGKIEFAVVGQGVSFCRRLEECCEPYRIMISTTTRNNLAEATAALPMTRRDVSGKLHGRLLEAFEVDAFAETPQKLQNGLRQYTASLGRKREEERHVLTGERRFPVHFPMGDGAVADYSRTGMRLEVPFYVSQGTQMMLTFDAKDCPAYEPLLAQSLTQLHVVVMWGRPLGEGRFSLGVLFVGMSKAQCNALVAILGGGARGVTKSDLSAA
jgi:class 3 adenylate cyclase